MSWIIQECGNRKKYILAQGQVNGHNVVYLFIKIFYLSHRTDNAQITQLSPYFAYSMHKFFKNRMYLGIKSIENSVDPDQLASEEAS